MNIIQKQVHRNILFIFLIIIFFVLGMLTRAAYAEESKKTRKVSNEQIPRRPEFKPTILKIKPAFTVQAKIAVIPNDGSLSNVVNLDVPLEADWVTQCYIYANQLGIELTNNAITLLDRESDCSPTAQNPSSTAYGIGQFLDSTWKGVGCVKTSDPLEQLRCMYVYVMQRYGSWDNALAHSSNYGWY